MTTETLDAIQPYSEVKAAIAKMKAESAGLTFDYATPKGNKLARSHVNTLRGYKGDIERKRKELKADALEFGRKVDAAAKELTGEVEAMIEVHDKPLREIEAREAARKQAHVERLALLGVPVDPITTSAACRSVLTRVASVVVGDEWEEFKTPALELQAASRRVLETKLADLLKQEAEAAELARLREEQAKRDAEARAKREADERERREAEIARAAAEKAKREAEQAAEVERRRAEAEANAARAKAEAQQRAALEAEREKARKAELAAAKAKQEKAEAEAKVAREQREREEADRKRAADLAHRSRILGEAAEALAKIIPAEAANAAIDAIASGKIPNVAVRF